MGAADIVPGVSGGTVALIVGIYDRLVQAIGRFDLQLLGHVKRKEWKAAAEYVDLRFLISLGLGICTGIVCLASLMHYLLEEQLPLTLAAFFGLILASSVLVGRMVDRWTVGSVLAAIVTALFSFWLVGLIPVAPYSGNGYLFLCGMLAICAMILPGISGAFVLLILGVYSDVTGLLRTVLHGRADIETLWSIIVFVSGCVIGLLSFSKLLNWLLGRYRILTMAALCGFMLGSLRKIWPFKIDLTPNESKFKAKIFENTLPDSLDTQVLLMIGIILISAAAVFLLDRMTAGHETKPVNIRKPH